MRPGKVRGTCEGSLGLLPPGSDPVRNLAAPRARQVYRDYFPFRSMQVSMLASSVWASFLGGPPLRAGGLSPKSITPVSTSSVVFGLACSYAACAAAAVLYRLSVKPTPRGDVPSTVVPLGRTRKPLASRQLAMSAAALLPALPQPASASGTSKSARVRIVAESVTAARLAQSWPGSNNGAILDDEGGGAPMKRLDIRPACTAARPASS